MTTRPLLIVKVLNAALGLDLASFAEARELLLSDEGDALLEAWLAVHCDDDETPRTAPLTTPAERTPR